MDSGQEKQINELKELVRQDIEIGDETRQMVHKMQRSARWSLFFTVLYWLLILGVLGAGYYYASPYLTQLSGFYQQVQSNGGQSHNFIQGLFETVGKYVQQGTTTQR